MSDEMEREWREVLEFEEDRSQDVQEQSTEIQEEIHEERQKKNFWSRKYTKLLVSKRMEAHDQFLKKNKTSEVLWRRVLINIKEEEPQFPFSKEEAIRKFHNLFQTYRRTKEKSKKSGNDSVKWEFFDDFDEIFGSKHSVIPPKNLLSATMEIHEEEEEEEEDIDEVEEVEELRPVYKKRRVQKSDEILTFLKTWTEEERKADIEEKKREDEKFKQSIEVEKQKIQAIKDLSKILKDMLE